MRLGLEPAHPCTFDPKTELLDQALSFASKANRPISNKLIRRIPSAEMQPPTFAEAGACRPRPLLKLCDNLFVAPHLHLRKLEDQSVLPTPPVRVRSPR